MSFDKKKKVTNSREGQHLILCKYSDNIARQYSRDGYPSPCSLIPRCAASPPAEKHADANTKGSVEVTEGCSRHDETSSREYGSFTREHADCLDHGNHRVT